MKIPPIFTVSVYGDRAELMQAAARWLEDRVSFCDNYYSRRPASAAQAWQAWGADVTTPVWVALAGGNTPLPVYEHLAKKDAPSLQRAVYMPTDERCVPEDDARSNVGMLRRTLGAGKRVLPLTEGTNIVAAYPDVALLGMGTDGHVASLFGDAPAAAWEGEEVVRLAPAGQPEARLSMPMPALAAAQELLLLICGAEKFALLGRGLRKNDDENLPITRLLAGRRSGAVQVYYAE